MDIYLDGTAGTPMYKFNGDINKPNKEIENLKPSCFYRFYTFSRKDNALIIGSEVVEMCSSHCWRSR